MNGIDWFKSSYSGSIGDCVEASMSLIGEGIVPVRDSKVPDAQHLKFSTSAFSAFVTSVKNATV